MKAYVPEQDLHDQDPVFFLHIPKTAGLSFAALLDNGLGRREIAPFYDYFQLREIPYACLVSHNYFKGHIHYDIMRALLPKSPVCLTLLREPIERFLSHFAHAQQHLNDNLLSPEAIEQFRQMSIVEFAANADLVNHLGNNNCQTDMLGGRFNFAGPEEIYDYDPLKLNLANEWQRVDLRIAQKRLSEFAFVGLTERFQESLFLLAFTFGWPPIVNFQKLNVAARRPRRDQLTADTLQKIEAWNTLDLELYSDAQRLFEARFSQMTQTLLERYGQRSQAHLKAPLPPEVIYTLLEKHYARRYAARHPLTHTLKFDFDQALPGSGWHAIQTLPEFGCVRWTGPGTQATLDVPLAITQDLSITFHVLMALAPDILDSLTLTVNDQPIPLTHGSEPEGGVIFQGHLPHSTLQRGSSFARLSFEVNRTLTPKMVNPHNDDERRLGVLFNWIKIFPAQ